MKRIIALLMTVILLSAVCCVTVYADSAEPPYEAPEDKVEPAATGFAADNLPAGADGTMQVPRIDIITENGNGASLEKADGYVNAQITVTDTDGSALNGDVSFKVRGNSTALSFVQKKSFTFKFAKKTEVLGMGKGKKWAMLANCFDPTLLRNYSVFEFARELGLPYTSEQRFVELWLDGNYHGCYIVCEPVQEGKDRVDIDIESNDGKKDFLLEYEASRVEDDVTYLTAGGLRFAMSDPEEPTEEQLAYITGVMNDIVNTLKAGAEEEIRRKIDVDSFAKLYLLNEYAKTADFGFSSVFFFYKDGVLYAGPAWDYDLSLGNLNSDLNSAVAKAAAKSDGILQSDKNFYRYLTDKDWFNTEIKRVYAEHYDYIENISADGGVLDSYREQYNDVFTRNFTVWRVNKWWLNYQKQPLATYEENYQLLKSWCAGRNTWLTDYYGLSRYSFLRGDADGNGILEITDATKIQRVLADLEEDSDGKIAIRAAFSDDTLNIYDATTIQRYIAMMDVPYELNEQTSVILY